MSKLGTRLYPWVILLSGLLVFGATLYFRMDRVPRPTELEQLVSAGEPEEHTHAVSGSADGTTYVGTHLGLVTGTGTRNWRRAQGITGDVTSLQAAGGAVYLSGPSLGVVRYAGGMADSLLTGAVQALAVDPQNANRLLAVTGGALLQESRDGGKSWRQLADLKSQKVLALAVAPGNPQLVVAGGLSGNLLRSGDGGSTWSTLPSPQGGISSLVFDTAPPHRLWAAAGGLIHHSADAGTTWTLASTRLKDRPLVGLGRGPGNGGGILAITADGLLVTAKP